MPAGRPSKSRSLYLARRVFVNELASASRAAQAAEDVATAATRHALTEDAFLRAAVAMEGFFTEWVVRCVSMDTSVLRATLEERASNYLSSRVGDWRTLPATYRVTASASITIPPRLSHQECRKLLDCEDDNLSIRGVADLQRTASEYIADVRGTYLSKLTSGERMVINATIAMRNFLVHRTERGRAQVNAALQEDKMPTSLAREQNLGSGDSVGRYLCVRRAGRARYGTYFLMLGSVATKMAPYKGAPVTIFP